MVGFSSAKVPQRNQNVVEAMDVQQQQCTTNHDVAGFVPRKCWTTCLESLRMFKIFLDSTVLLHSTTTEREELRATFEFQHMTQNLDRFSTPKRVEGKGNFQFLFARASRGIPWRWYVSDRQRQDFMDLV
jgi:hypothetical protein